MYVPIYYTYNNAEQLYELQDCVRVLKSCKQQHNNWLGLAAQRRRKRQTRKEGVGEAWRGRARRKEEGGGSRRREGGMAGLVNESGWGERAATQPYWGSWGGCLLPYGLSEGSLHPLLG